MKKGTPESTPWGTPNFPGTLGGSLGHFFGQKALRKHSPEHFRRLPKKHSCKWPAGSQIKTWMCIELKDGCRQRRAHDSMDREPGCVDPLRALKALYIYICMLWSYYLGHVWGFLIVTNWATFVFLKRLFFKKNTIKIGVSADFLFKKKRGPKIFNSY